MEPTMLRNRASGPLGGGMPVLDPVSAAWNTVARFDDYASAQRAVDRLSDDGFPVENSMSLDRTCGFWSASPGG
jgi:hypothetical protein